MGRGRPAAGVRKTSPTKTISKQDRKDLEVLADDFGLSHRQEVQDIMNGIIKLMDRQSDKYEQMKDSAVDSFEAQKDAAEAVYDAQIEGIEAQIDAINDQIDAIDAEIEAKEKQAEAIQDEIDKIRDAREERQKELDLQKAQYEFQRIPNGAD